MKKNLLVTIVSLMLTASTASAQQVEGYLYGNEQAPDGTEWQSPEKLSLNKEQPHAWFFAFQNADAAKAVLPEKSNYYASLDGQWSFHWSADPNGRATGFEQKGYSTAGWDKIEVPSSWNVAGIEKNGNHKYGIPIYINQGGIFYHKVEVGDWKKGVMREPPHTWTTYKYRNEVGQYVRTFSIPADWDGRRVMLNFDGVDSFFYLWINGHYVGFSKDSRCLAQFDITKYLNKGENTVAVEVYRTSDASFLEVQDMMRMAGIYRSVYLTSLPQVHVSDLKAIPDLDAQYTNGTLNVSANVRNLSAKDVKGYSIHYALYPVELYGDNTATTAAATADVPLAALTSGSTTTGEAKLTVANANTWSAEAPWRYVLVGELKDKKGRVVESFSTYTGFRKVEIRDTEAKDDEFGLAGRYFYVNGKTVKLKGVNRHEAGAERGHAVTREQMEKEVMLMKRANINHVRGSHYPDAPYWYYLCDKYGIYLEDECNLESHLYYYGKASLSHVPEFRKAHVARQLDMVHADINHPSIVIWSLGNEAGPGDNFKACYQAIKDYDTSRPVQYERNNNIVDMGSNQYPSIAWVRNAVKGTADLKYPFHISEYAHSMGNAAGNLIDYWDAIESTNFFCGGAIWEWIDHGLYDYTADGTRYVAYGGDFGDFPNSGTFCLDGIMFADLSPKPQYYEVKKVYQNIGIKEAEALKSGHGSIEIFNKNYFEPADYTICWTLTEDGTDIANGKIEDLQPIAARTKRNVAIKFDPSIVKADHEYFIRIALTQKHDMPWAKAGYVQAEEQLAVKAADQRVEIAQAATGSAPKVEQKANTIEVKGKGFEASFDNAQGTLKSLKYNGKDIIAEGCGPKIDAFRAPLDNDNWAYPTWYANGLNDLRHRATAHTCYTRPDGSVVVAYDVVAQAPCAYKRTGGTSGRIKVEPVEGSTFGETDFKFTASQVWTIYPDGSVELESAINSNNSATALPRLGYMLRVPKALSQYTYYGRGPINNYNDRKTSQNIGLYHSTVAQQFLPFGKPQSMSNNEDVRWCALTDATGTGAVFVAKGTMSTSALPYSEQALDTTAHPHQLPEAGDTYLHLDCKVTGLGGNSCGQGGPLTDDVTKAEAHSFGFIIRPANNDLQQQAAVSATGETPLLMSRSKNGELTITSQKYDATVYMSINGKRAQKYTGPFNFKQGGKIVAWDAASPKLKAAATYEKTLSSPTEVIFASSVETEEGDISYLTDGNPATFWHTMYSVTVAKYPHWIDMDAGETKMISGISCLPRQDSRNGRIKEYKVQTSLDGKTWSAPVAQGEFADDAKEKNVMFAHPVKARYVRFTAISSCNGQDYATMAEIGILAE